MLAQITANASLEPARIETGDTFGLRILVSGTEVSPRDVHFNAWQSLFPAENILSSSKWLHSGSRWVRQYTLIAFDSSLIQLPPLSVILPLGDSVPTNGLELLVVPTGSSTNLSDMEPIREIRTEPSHWTDSWPWLLGGCIVVVAGWWWLRRKQKVPPPIVVQAPPPVFAAPQPSPQETALAKLAALEQDKGWEKTDIQPFYTALSMIVREYMEQRYGVLALESTTRELLPQLRATDFPKSLAGPLEALLQRADMVKFADYLPEAGLHRGALESARQVVRG